nr:hypothetical protein [Tanacetum cinerariifolium]
MSLKDAKEKSTKSDFDDDETRHVHGFMVESSKKKELKKFDFITEDGEHVHLTKEQINQQKKIEEEAKAEAARREGKIRKEELIDLLGLEVEEIVGFSSRALQSFTSTPVVAEMRKEDQQAAGDLTSLGVTSEEGTHP